MLYEKKNLAFFLGAGASKAFGLPLTREIFPLIWHQLKNKTLFQGNESEIQHLGSFIQSIFPGLEIVDEQKFPLITDLLSLLDHAILKGYLLTAGDNMYRYEQYRYLLEKAIMEILENREDTTNKYLRYFVEWIFRHCTDQMTTIISTNYDNMLEHSLYGLFRAEGLEIHKNIDFGFDWREPGTNALHLRPPNPLTSIYKLHGSSNWLKCDLCNHIYVNTYGNTYSLAYNKKTKKYNSCECGHGPMSALIVAPSLSREVLDTNLPHIWHHAQERLRQADEWIIIGYSLPAEDLYIRSMFIRALSGRDAPPKIFVVQKDDLAKSRYLSMMGDISYETGGLEQYINARTHENIH